MSPSTAVRASLARAITRHAAATLMASLLACALSAFCAPASAQPARNPLGSEDIDRLVARSMEAFSIPGIAVGVVKDGKLAFARGYGVRELGKPERVDADTLYAIGSTTKAFTTAALAMLVDEGKLGWDDKVIDHLPDFRMYDPYVTREFTVRDLVTHRSGLGLGAGDLMFVPATDFTRDEVLRGLRHLKPVSSFRSEFAYDNLLYVIAGQLVPAVTGGTSWEDFVTTRILAPLQMEPCAVGDAYVKQRSNMASYHIVVDGKVTKVPAQHWPVIGPAGTMACNVTGLAKWVATQLAGGKTPTGARLFSEAQRDEMWSPQTLLPQAASPLNKLTRTHLTAYGLGWDIQDYQGYKRVSHSGGVLGQVVYISMLPELDVGVIVLTNQMDGYAIKAITQQILDAYAGAASTDWVATFKSASDQRQKAAQDAVSQAMAGKGSAGKGKPTLPLAAYAGTYRDPWRGDAQVRLENGRLMLKVSRTQGLEGPLEFYSGNIFIVRWNDRSLNADAYVRFTQGYDDGIAGMTMKAVSPATDFSFDFHDLDFKKIDAR